MREVLETAPPIVAMVAGALVIGLIVYIIYAASAISMQSAMVLGQACIEAAGSWVETRHGYQCIR